MWLTYANIYTNNSFYISLKNNIHLLPHIIIRLSKPATTTYSYEAS